MSLTLTNNTNVTSLRIINNIEFTNRELDVIACILAGKATKKIASLLSISTKTVENHIHNIRIKIGCNSRVQIIDFLEKSNQCSAIKTHYAMLLGPAKLTAEYYRQLTKPKSLESISESQPEIKNFNIYSATNNKTLLSKKTVIFLLIVSISLSLGLSLFKTKSAISKFFIKNISKHTTTLETNNKIFVNLPPRNPNFTGRKQLLTHIKQQLTKQKFGVVTQAISGLGGIGKTQLAIEFAYLAAEQKEYSAIFWIPAETTNAIGTAYKEIANHMQLDIKGLELDNIQTLVHNKLATIYQNSKILFILDNVPNYNDINDYLAKAHKQLTPFLSPYILITSRSQHWPEAPLILDIFTKTEALAFVQKYLPGEIVNNIERLTATLRFFPLALAQAVAYINRHTNINDYLELYALKQEAYLDKFPGDKNQYNESLWKTWNIIINKLSAAAREILFISAYLEPDNITLDFFNQLDPEKRANAIEELRSYSLTIMINNNKAFKIHRLLQEVIRLSIKHNSNYQHQMTLPSNVLKTENYWLTKAMYLLKTKFDFDYLQPKKWKYWSKYLPHAETIATNAITVPGKTFQQGLKLYIKYAMSLTYVQCDSKHAIAAWTKIGLLISQHYKSQALKFIMANFNSNLGYAQNYAGKYQDALKLMNNKVFPIYQQPLPKISPEERELLDVLRIVSFKTSAVNDETRRKCDLNFAFETLEGAQYRLGFIQEALTSNSKSFKIFGTKQIDSISLYYKNNALWVMERMYIYLGQFVEAEKTRKKAKLDDNKLLVNDQTYDQAYIHESSAILMYQLGKFKEAISALNEFSSRRLAILSPHHIRNADTQVKLGFNNYMLGNITNALHNFTQAESIYKLSYSDDVVHYVFTNLGLWKIYESLGDHKKALDYMQTTLKIASLQYGGNVNSTMTFQLTQAEVWPKLSTFYPMNYWQTALHVNQNLFGHNHYQTAKYHYMLGQALEHEHKLQTAHEHYQQALAILATQKIRHPKLEQFYIKNIAAITNGITRTRN